MVLDLSERARAFLQDLQPKQYKQLAARVFALSEDQQPHDSRHMSGQPGYKRIDQGEYRIIFCVRQSSVCIAYIGKRNDDEVYREFARRQ